MSLDKLQLPGFLYGSLFKKNLVIIKSCVQPDSLKKESKRKRTMKMKKPKKKRKKKTKKTKEKEGKKRKNRVQQVLSKKKVKKR